jgi:hypothetical protein
MEWEAKAQVGLLVILLVGKFYASHLLIFYTMADVLCCDFRKLTAMLDFCVGSFMGPQNDSSIAKGWIGLNGKEL